MFAAFAFTNKGMAFDNLLYMYRMKDSVSDSLVAIVRLLLISGVRNKPLYFDSGRTIVASVVNAFFVVYSLSCPMSCLIFVDGAVFASKPTNHGQIDLSNDGNEPVFPKVNAIPGE